MSGCSHPLDVRLSTGLLMSQLRRSMVRRWRCGLHVSAGCRVVNTGSKVLLLLTILESTGEDVCIDGPGADRLSWTHIWRCYDAICLANYFREQRSVVGMFSVWLLECDFEKAVFRTMGIRAPHAPHILMSQLQYFRYYAMMSCHGWSPIRRSHWDMADPIVLRLLCC